MREQDEFDRRIAVALDRIRYGLHVMGAAPLASDGASIAALRGELDEERVANAQLEERVRLLKDRQDTKVTALESSAVESRARLSAMSEDLQALHQSNAELRDVIGSLRAALADGMADPELINRAILAELDAVTAARDADRAELNAVIAELAPLLAEER
jgi:predicted  nucleic acid-binding Zn-ribbon protein